MNEFLILLKFEYKKIFKKKSTGISLLLLLIITLAIGMTGIQGYSYVDGKKATSHYDDMVTDRAYEKALSGRSLDKELILETQQAYRHINPDTRFMLTEEYQLYARPYSVIRGIILEVYSPGKTMDIERLLNLKQEEAKNFYELRNAQLLRELEGLNLSKAEMNKHLRLNAQVKTPFTFEYSGGYKNFLLSAFPIGLFVVFSTAICLAPVFAGEYTSNTAPIILSSKHRNMETAAKLVTGITFSISMSIIYLSVTLLECCCIYGFGGAGAPVQLLNVLMSYPLTMLNSCGLLILCNVTVNLLVAGITLLLSSRLKSPFGVIILVSLLLFAPLLIKVSENIRSLYDLVHMLPSNMLDINVVFGRYMYHFLASPVLPYLYIPLFCIVLSCCLMLFTFRSFHKHQVI